MISTSKPTQFDSLSVSSLTPDLLHHWMQQCRQGTLSLFSDVDYDTFCHQAHPDFSPVGWHLGHIAYTESLWILERLAGLPPQFPDYHRLFAADILPKCDRVNLPNLATIQRYLAAIRSQVSDYLAVAPIQAQSRLWLWLLQHESQHCETIALVLEMCQKQAQPRKAAEPHKTSNSIEKQKIEKQKLSALSPLNLPHNREEMVFIPAGICKLGNNAPDALDNECPVHLAELKAYWIDRFPVTCGQYRAFMAAGGYADAQWWSALGWQWLQANPVIQPRYWDNHAGWDAHPVCGVSWYEADAYARFVGKRLPTEAEWEKAASWDQETGERSRFPWGNTMITRAHANHFHQVGQTTPVHAYPAGKSASGCYDLLGNVWEWTDSWFAGYENFVSYPYHGYSEAYFDQQHRVLKGGSWATRPWAMRNAFRNWYHPQTREVFAGFRCAKGDDLNLF
jgi:gamma-glutamyl hercynylcysteine S-oxide synthase